MLTAPLRSRPLYEKSTMKGCRLKPCQWCACRRGGTATEWRQDPEAAIEIEARLDRNGFDAIDLNAEAFVQARELFLMFDQLMHSAQNRRIRLLLEIRMRREFLKRARRL
jgi:hypothetical protein